MEKKTRSNFCNAFCIIGFPDEIGIQNVQGRLGAKLGPNAFLEAFQKLNGKNKVQDKMSSSKMVTMGTDLERNFEQSIKMVKDEAIASLVVGIGGGHDYAYPWIVGLSQAFTRNGSKKPKIGCINLDAHFDLRAFHPKMTSGSPFRRLIEEGWIEGKNLVEFGIQDHCNPPELWEYAKSRKVVTHPLRNLRNGKAITVFRRELTRLKKTCEQVVISLDLDALSVAFCPGVSAPQGEGFTASEIYQMLEIAGGDKKVTSLGIFELSPPLDFQNQTSRVAAQATWHFLNAKLYP
jgi:formiminoglutamase